MNSISCVRCGLKNWVEDDVCKRCGHGLAFIEAVSDSDQHAKAGGVVELGFDQEEFRICSFCGTQGSGVLCRVCRKPLRFVASPQLEERGRLRLFLTSANGIVTTMIVLALVATGVAYGVARRRSNEKLEVNAKLADAIRSAERFSAPVFISFAENSSELAPGVRVLMEKGLVSYRLGTTPRTIQYEETDKETGEVVRGEKEDPAGGRPYAHVELTPRGALESGSWRRRRTGSNNDTGWSVPIGARELVEVTAAQSPRTLAREDYERLPAATRATILPTDVVVPVAFTWRWKPDELGQYFDVNTDDHRSLSASAQESARACGHNDSARIRTGLAALVYQKGQPIVRAVIFDDDKKN